MESESETPFSPRWKLEVDSMAWQEVNLPDTRTASDYRGLHCFTVSQGRMFELPRRQPQKCWEGSSYYPPTKPNILESVEHTPRTRGKKALLRAWKQTIRTRGRNGLESVEKHIKHMIMEFLKAWNGTSKKRGKNTLTAWKDVGNIARKRGQQQLESVDKNTWQSVERTARKRSKRIEKRHLESVENMLKNS